MNAALGIDIGGTSIKAALLIDGAEAWSGTSERYRRPPVAELLSHLASLLGGVPLWEPSQYGFAIGLCVPGVLDKAGKCIQRSVNMPGLVGVDLSGLIVRSLPAALAHAGVHIRIVSDVHAAAIDACETMSLSGRTLAISLGTGVGAAVLDHRTPLVVTGRSSGHFGQMDVSVAGIEPVPVGPDSGRGSLEAYIGLPALAARHGDAERWLRALRGSEPELAALARALRIAHAIYRPRHVLLLGGVGIRLAGVLEPLRAMTADALTSVADPDWSLRCGTSDLHAACGAARLALPADRPPEHPDR